MTKIFNDKSNNLTKIIFQELCKTKDKIDICINISNNRSSAPFIVEILINSITEIKKNRKTRVRCIVDTLEDNLNYFKKLIPLVEEIRYLNAVKDTFFINDTTYAAIFDISDSYQQQSCCQLIIIKAKSFVKQQQYFFDLLWNKAVLISQETKDVEEGKQKKRKEEAEVKVKIDKVGNDASLVKTQVLQKQEELYERIIDFYKNSNQIKFCSPVDGIKIAFKHFFYLHQEILERYRQGKHKGIKWITSLNNKKDIEIVKSYVDKGIEVRHVKDLLTNSFSLSDKSFFFTIEKIEEGKFGNNVLSSNDKLYLDHYDTVFENLWKKGIDIHDRIKDIEEGYFINVDTISNPKESIKIFDDLFNTAKKEILLILSSINSVDRIESNNDFDTLQRLTIKGIKIKIIIPSNTKLQYKIDELKSKHPNIEFKGFNASYEPFIGITVIDREKVLINEVKDDSKKDYYSSMGLTIYIEGKSAALSYASIFDNLIRQTDLYDKLKKAYEKVENHDKMQKEFIEIASHELRTPIHPMLGFIEILRNRITDKEQLEFLDIIYRNTKRLKKLSEDILEVSKVENKLFNLKKEQFNIKKLIQHLIINYKKQIETENIEFEFEDYLDNNFVIFADKEKINQVIINLINNSIKFIQNKKRGKISITVEKRTKDKDDDNDYTGNHISNLMAVITIKDNGTGIDTDILPLLFTKFASKSFQGTGLGLYISKNIVEAHGGRIWAKNNNEDRKGATFSFSLPLIKDEKN